MTIEEFDNKSWCAETKAIYNDVEYYVGSVNFYERLLGLWTLDSDMEDESDMSWVRCENVKIF